MHPRLKHVATELSQPRILLRLSKIAAVLSVELALAPLACALATVTPAGPRAERLLLLQNLWRRRGLRWIFPEFR